MSPHDIFKQAPQFGAQCKVLERTNETWSWLGTISIIMEVCKKMMDREKNDLKA
jgi:hypothetical protein